MKRKYPIENYSNSNNLTLQIIDQNSDQNVNNKIGGSIVGNV